ncbi:hypothetical protein FRC20_005884 [Serendipita sp. 405]|nr:hypothetical protein FRC20_005884 [Serendipita sp. 405]
MRIAGVVVNGVGMSLNIGACLSGIYLCIFFYASSKIIIYIFLAEKVHVVWSAGKSIRRLKSRVWLVCCFVLIGYLVVFVLMLIARIGYFREDHTCVIGLRKIATIPLLTYDIFLNIFLTGLFVWPLYYRRLSNAKLRSLATRTCIAAAAALCTSVINIAILTTLHGKQLAWVCLASCTSDVTINALVIFAISQTKENGPHPHAGADAPIASEKNISYPSPVIMFKEKLKRNRSKPDLTFGRSQSATHLNTFPVISGQNSDSSISTICPFNTVPYSPNAYEYLPKDHMPVVDGSTVATTPTSEKSEPSFPDINRLSAAYQVQRQEIQGSGSRSFIGHGRRGSSRQLLGTFPKPHSNAEDLEIQVTIVTEHTPTDDSPLGTANTRIQGI